MIFTRTLRLFAALMPAFLAAQTSGTLNLYPVNPAAEQNELNQAVTEANGSAIDLTRALEQYLRKYPNSARRAEIEASLYKTAVESNDTPRIVTYGEKLLTGHPENELEMLERVTRALLVSNDAESAKKALAFSNRYDTAVQDMRGRMPEGHTTKAQWADLGDRAFARALVLKARATGNLGNLEEALMTARQSWLMMPTGEAAQEMGRWSEKLNRPSDAAAHYAEAAMIDDLRLPWSDRDRLHNQASELYKKAHGSEEGLGDLFLTAWNRDAQAMLDRTARYKAMDRNYGLTNMYDFILPGGGNVSGTDSSLDMSKLHGKTLVIDFWATWCMPCIAQHPLIEHVKQKYAGAADVVFLSLDADDDHSLVAPFLKTQKWEQRVYLEAGLAGLLNVASLPTILVIDPYGKIYSRMMGFSTDVFERMLSTRIDEARSVLPPK